MLSNLLLEQKSYTEESFTYKKRRRLERNSIAKAKRKKLITSIISLGLIIISSFFITHKIYVCSNSKDLGFAVEYNFTSEHSNDYKLLRVQKMSLVYFDGDTAIVEASGLSSKAPHKNTSIRGSFKKDGNKSWFLEKILS